MAGLYVRCLDTMSILIDCDRPTGFRCVEVKTERHEVTGNSRVNIPVMENDPRRSVIASTMFDHRKKSTEYW